MTQNMYRVGDYVYLESFASSPYQIRRIEELNKTHAGAEAKVVCFFRRRDLPPSLLKIADQAERQNQILPRPKKTLLSSQDTASTNGTVKGISGENGSAENEDMSADAKRSYGFAGLPLGANELSPERVHELRQHELFLSRQYDTIPATQIRGKCTVVILNEVETCDMYLEHQNSQDAYFYSLVYDPSNQTLLADKGKIEIGSRHQAEIPAYIGQSDEEKMSVSKENASDSPNSSGEESNKPSSVQIQLTDREQVVYHPHHELTDRDIDQFLIIARAVGTFSRALDATSGMKLPSLHMTASAASRDVTILHAMAFLHQANYDIGQATKYLVPPPNKQCYPFDVDKSTSHNTASLGGPILCRDQLEEWSAAEATLFEDAIEKYGKDFFDIRVDCLPWKSIRDIVEYYYMWKTTARYTEIQKNKATEDHKLKQVYIPNYTKPNPNLIAPQNSAGQPFPIKSATPCEDCFSFEANQWYSWGPSHMHLRLCGSCWILWKKHGGLKHPHECELYDLDGSGDITGRGAPTAGRPNISGLNRPLTSQTRSNGQQMKILQNPSANPKGHFFLHTALEAKIARRMASKGVFNMRKSARSPFKAIDIARLKTYYFSRPIAEIIKTAQQVKPNTLAKLEMEHLTKLHQNQKRAQTNAAPFNGGASAPGAPSIAAGQQGLRRN